MARRQARNSRFEQVQQRILDCRLCPRLVDWRERTAREKVRRHRNEIYWGRPVPAFGGREAELLVVGLAPAAHGANRTGRMFTGDSSGDWLYQALHRFGFASRPCSTGRNDGLQVQNCLVTAALRCAPPENKPLREELETCRRYLIDELALLVQVRVVVALGQIAFRAFLKAWQDRGGDLPPDKLGFRHLGEWKIPAGPVLISSYHPSRQNTQTGRLTRPMFHRVFRRARHLLDRASPGRR